MAFQGGTSFEPFDLCFVEGLIQFDGFSFSICMFDSTFDLLKTKKRKWAAEKLTLFVLLGSVLICLSRSMRSCRLLWFYRNHLGYRMSTPIDLVSSSWFREYERNSWQWWLDHQDVEVREQHVLGCYLHRSSRHQRPPTAHFCSTKFSRLKGKMQLSDLPCSNERYPALCPIRWSNDSWRCSLLRSQRWPLYSTKIKSNREEIVASRTRWACCSRYYPSVLGIWAKVQQHWYDRWCICLSL